MEPTRDLGAIYDRAGTMAQNAFIKAEADGAEGANQPIDVPWLSLKSSRPICGRAELYRSVGRF